LATPQTGAGPNAWLVGIERQLGPLLGDFTAKMALQTAALRSLKKPPEQLTRADAPALLEGLRPMLNTFLGVARAKVVLESLTSSLAA
jgi:hypothetical protein